MEQNLIATYHDEQKKYRLKIYRDVDCGSDGPLNWGWHLNFADHDRNYSLDKQKNGEPMSNLRYLVSRYADAKKVRRWLKAKDERTKHGEDYAEYDRSGNVWRLFSKGYGGDYYQETYFTPQDFKTADSYLLEQLSDDCICTIANTMMGDGVKMASYSFNYYSGEPGFDDEVSENMTGLMWIEKSDYLKDNGGNDERWHLPMTELMAGMIDSLQRWARGDVYGFELEKAVKWQVHRECLSEEREPEDYEETDWEFVDSCWGYYMESEELAEEIESEHGLPKMLEAA